MNNSKRTFNPLLGKTFRYAQSENAELKYQGNWGPQIQTLTIASSEWVVEYGSAVLASEAATTTVTSVIISGNAGESKIINKVTLSDGQVDERAIMLKIRSNNDPYLNSDYGI